MDASGTTGLPDAVELDADGVVSPALDRHTLALAILIPRAILQSSSESGVARLTVPT